MAGNTRSAKRRAGRDRFADFATKSVYGPAAAVAQQSLAGNVQPLPQMTAQRNMSRPPLRQNMSDGVNPERQDDWYDYMADGSIRSRRGQAREWLPDGTTRTPPRPPTDRRRPGQIPMRPDETMQAGMGQGLVGALRQILGM